MIWYTLLRAKDGDPLARADAFVAQQGDRALDIRIKLAVVPATIACKFNAGNRIWPKAGVQRHRIGTKKLLHLLLLLPSLGRQRVWRCLS